jgi:HK97 family phage prohead protease
MNMKRIWNEIKSVKAEDGGAVSIEGWANKAVVDDVGDLMDFSAVDMKRYEKNPILLYNHDRNLPIGKVVEAKVEKDGLWVKALISNSKDVVVSYVRDLVKEGILKTFSIGFEPKKEDRKDGVNVIKEWRLNEISIVTLPANIEAEFALAKSLGEAKSLDEARALVLKAMEPPPPPTPPEGEEDKPENKEPTDEAKNAFQECVSAKIPKLIEEGRACVERKASAPSNS